MGAVPGPELIIGFVGAAGTDLQFIIDQFSRDLASVGYNSDIIRLSGLLLDCSRYKHLRGNEVGPQDVRINSLMDAGDGLRRTAKRGDAVALLVLGKIREIRKQRGGDEGHSLARHAFLLHSLKHPAEMQTLRDIYGEAFVAVSAYTPRIKRLEALSDRITKSHSSYKTDDFEGIAKDLIDKDEKEVGDDLGQNVRDTFPEADIFVDASLVENIPAQITRFVEILFRNPFRTPTVDEAGLFHAKAAALRSADLSRQVGAMIGTDRGEIIAIGCNEVPIAKGGSFWEGDGEQYIDNRDFKIGYDSSARMKKELFEEVFAKLREAEWLSPNVLANSNAELVDMAVFDRNASILSGTRAASIIEFGRIVHAEMGAITDAARRGRALAGTTLYCTTFPCHMCARHIVSSGIDRVVYVEPYPKSMAKDLYRGSVDVDHDPSASAGAVKFRPFVGISPRRYMSFFEMPKRKDGRGYALPWDAKTAMPRVKQSSTYLDVELAHFEILAANKVEWGLVDVPTQLEESANV
jgi:deoxycytidylate deaminase